MKQYSIEVRMSYYVWVDVEALDEHSARDQALRKAHREQERGRGTWGEEPQALIIIEKKERA